MITREMMRRDTEEAEVVKEDTVDRTQWRKRMEAAANNRE